MNTEDGGPAFPMHTPDWHEQQNEAGYNGCDFTMGMSLRDYFAAKYIAGYMAHPGIGFASRDEAAQEAYLMADALLAARNAG